MGSGGVRGLALIGALKVLEKNKIRIDYLTGCSIGAFMAAYYAHKKNLKDMEEKVCGYKRQILLSFMQPSLRGGLSSGKKMRQILDKFFGEVCFEDLSIPTKVTATDLLSGREVNFDSGLVSPAVCASMAMPFFYRPVRYQGMTLLDGALSNPVPDNVAKEMGADVVVAVNLHDYRLPRKFKSHSLYLTSVRALHIVFENLSHYSLQPETILVEPDINLSGLGGWRDFFLSRNDREVIRAGATAMKKALPEIIRRLRS